MFHLVLTIAGICTSFFIFLLISYLVVYESRSLRRRVHLFTGLAWNGLYYWDGQWNRLLTNILHQWNRFTESHWNIFFPRGGCFIRYMFHLY